MSNLPPDNIVICTEENSNFWPEKVNILLELNENKVGKGGAVAKKCGTLHDFACHPCAGAMLIFSVSFQF